MNDYDIAYDAVFKICELYEKQYVSQISKNLSIPKTEVIYYINLGILNFDKSKHIKFFKKIEVIRKVCDMYTKKEATYTVKSLSRYFKTTPKNISHMLHDGIRINEIISDKKALEIRNKVISNVKEYTKFNRVDSLEKVYKKLFSERSYAKLNLKNEIFGLINKIQEVNFQIETYDSAEEEFTDIISLEYLLKKQEYLQKQLQILTSI